MTMTQRYLLAGHRIQTAIAVLMGYDSYTAADPKHMRVGIDLTKSDMAGLAQLLINKGVFTEAEYLEAVTVSAETEADTYEKEVQTALGRRDIITR